MGALHVNGQKVAGVNIEIKPEIYSTEEREVGVWIDGKPIYQKTWDVGEDLTVSRSSFTTISEITIPNIEMAILCEGVKSNTTNQALSHGTLMIALDQLPAIRFQTTRNSADALVRYFTIWYTKTTDQPGSGTWTPDGAYAHHYSTDEKIVGTWIDGKTIYEKTTAISITISNADTFYNTDLSANGIDMFIGGTIIDIRNQSFPASVVKMNNDTNIGISIPNGNRDTKFLTYQYTKSSS